MFTFNYENLLEHSRQVISELLEFTGLPWNNIVVNHQKYYQGDSKKYPGGTRGDRPLDTTNKQRKLNLSPSEIQSITSICQEQMAIYGYENMTV